MRNESLLQIARRGDLALLIERLELVVRGFSSTCVRSAMDEDDRLLDEALTYARLGDLAEATHRLRLRAEPKWRSEEACMDAYKKAMREKRDAEKKAVAA